MGSISMSKDVPTQFKGRIQAFGTSKRVGLQVIYKQYKIKSITIYIYIYITNPRVIHLQLVRWSISTFVGGTMAVTHISVS